MIRIGRQFSERNPVGRVQKAYEFFRNQLFSKAMQNNLTIRLHMGKSQLPKDSTWMVFHDANGSEKQREFDLYIDPTVSEREQINAMGHELVHVKQKATGRLQFRTWKTDGKLHVRWEGKDLGPVDDIRAENQPWEIEAQVESKKMMSAFSKEEF